MLVEIPNFLSDEECDKLIERIDESSVRSSVAGSGANQSKYDSARTSSTSNLGKEELAVLIQTRISKELNIDIVRGEDLQGQKYEPGQYFRPHNDFFEGDSYTNHCLHSGNRTHTFMIYLNDDLEGGETNFPNLGTSVKPEKGKAVWWYDMVDGELQRDTLHEGSDVISGTKYIVTSWWRERPWNNALDTQLASVHHRNTEKSSKQFSNWQDLPKIDPVGFKVVKVPDEAWSIIQELYAEVKEIRVEEKFDGKESIIPGEGITSYIMDINSVPDKRHILHNMLLPLHQEFAKEPIDPTFIYGIRSYMRGAALQFHRDRIATHHISSIIIVDKDLACGCVNKPESDDWGLDIQSHDGSWHNVTAEVGEMILYESATCQHGRNTIFQGTAFNNMFVHYKLKDWEYVGN
jgi:prolyl 4-hydroxylase